LEEKLLEGYLTNTINEGDTKLSGENSNYSNGNQNNNNSGTPINGSR